MQKQARTYLERIFKFPLINAITREAFVARVELTFRFLGLPEEECKEFFLSFFSDPDYWGSIKGMDERLTKEFAKEVEDKARPILDRLVETPKCPHCGGDLGGVAVGRLEHHAPTCPLFPL